MECEYNIIVVGGGLAGLTAAIHLAKSGHQVLVFEKQQYPHHKVCGEYVSNEVLPYLRKLGISLEQSQAVSINMLQLSTAKGKYVETDLPLGGKGISRYALDELLYQKAITYGVSFHFQNIESIEFQNSIFKVIANNNQTYTSNIVIGAYGKRSALDKSLTRAFIQKKSAWIAVKAHYEYSDFPEHLVALHNFHGGYGGLSKTETGAVNFCYLASYQSFQKEKNISGFNEKVVAKNPFLREFLQKATPIFEQPLTIAQISFHHKKAVEKHVLMCGDTAGLIHPLCGNGMAMAIHSAKIAAELVDAFLRKKIADRNKLEYSYQKQWNKAFKRRLWTGRRLQALLLNHTLADRMISTIIWQPKILSTLIKNTHGDPII